MSAGRAGLCVRALSSCVRGALKVRRLCPRVQLRVFLAQHFTALRRVEPSQASVGGFSATEPPGSA